MYNVDCDVPVCLYVFGGATRLWYKKMADIFFFFFCLFVCFSPPLFVLFVQSSTKIPDNLFLFVFGQIHNLVWTVTAGFLIFQSRIWKSIGGYNGRNGKMTRRNIGTKVPAIKGESWDSFGRYKTRLSGGFIVCTIEMMNFLFGPQEKPQKEIDLRDKFDNV